MSNRKYLLNNVEETSSSIKLLYVTVSDDEGDWPSFMHSHYFTELFYVKSGSGQFLAGDASYSIHKDDLIIVSPNVSHTERSSQDRPLSYIAIGVEGLLFSFKEQNECNIFSCARDKEHLLFYFNSMLSEMERQEEGYQDICRWMLNILTLYLKRITNFAFDVIVSEHLNENCARIKRYIDFNYKNQITLDFLAELAHLNKYYFVHVFTKAYGLSPISYLNERRIQVSKELLETTNYSISEIAQLSGFSSQSYFAQSFKKNCHMTAGDYRKKIRQDS